MSQVTTTAQQEAATETTAADTLVSTREVPWMKLGKLSETVMTAAEAAELGGLNFTVSFYPVTYTDKNGVTKFVDKRLAVERDDTGVPLEVVSTTYEPLQYVQAFDFMDSVNPTYVAAGALHGGRQGFMVVRAPTVQRIDLLGEDPCDLYVVLRTSHDRSRAVEASVMPLRGRCMNQLTLRGFAKDAQHRIAIKHSSGLHKKLSEAKTVLTNLDAYTAELGRTAERLAEKKIDDSVATHILERVIKARPTREKVVGRIIDMWHNSPTVGYDGTGYGLVNAVSEYYDWGRAGGSPTSRFVAALQGQTHSAINRTAALLLSRVN